MFSISLLCAELFFALAIMMHHGPIKSKATAKALSPLERTHLEMGWYTTALETFYVDMNTYPPYTTSSKELAVYSDARQGTPSFKNFPLKDKWPSTPGQMDPVNDDALVNGITTPVSYLSALTPDPFSSAPTSPFAYLGDEHGYLIWSAGPDGKYDINWKEYNTKVGPTDAFKVKYTYDPTNGAVSSGDIWKGAGGHNLSR